MKKEIKEYLTKNRISITKLNDNNVDLDAQNLVEIIDKNLDQYMSNNFEILNKKDFFINIKNKEILLKILENNYVFNCILDTEMINVINIVDILLSEEQVLMNKEKLLNTDYSAKKIYNESVKVLIHNVVNLLMNENIDPIERTAELESTEKEIDDLKLSIKETYCLDEQDMLYVEDSVTKIKETFDIMLKQKNENTEEENIKEELEKVKKEYAEYRVDSENKYAKKIKDLTEKNEELQNSLKKYIEEANIKISEISEKNIQTTSQNINISNEINYIIEKVDNIISVTEKNEKVCNHLSETLTLIKGMFTANISIVEDTNSKISNSKLLNLGKAQPKQTIDIPNSDYMLVRKG